MKEENEEEEGQDACNKDSSFPTKLIRQPHVEPASYQAFAKSFKEAVPLVSFDNGKPLCNDEGQLGKDLIFILLSRTCFTLEESIKLLIFSKQKQHRSRIKNKSLDKARSAFVNDLEYYNLSYYS